MIRYNLNPPALVAFNGITRCVYAIKGKTKSKTAHFVEATTEEKRLVFSIYRTREWLWGFYRADSGVENEGHFIFIGKVCVQWFRRIRDDIPAPTTWFKRQA